MNNEKGFVYLLADSLHDNMFKIGVTRGTIESRIKKLQTGNPGEIYMCQSYHTDHPFFIEKYLHTSFGVSRAKGEWFELPNEDALKFKEKCEFAENMIKELDGCYGFPKNIK